MSTKDLARILDLKCITPSSRVSDMLESAVREAIMKYLGELVSPLRGTHDELTKLNKNIEDSREELTKLNKNIEEFTTSQDSLSQKIYWLNVILTIATAFGTLIALVTLAKSW